MRDILVRIQADPRYQRNIQYGTPRRGHAEGAIAAHIAELERNLDLLTQSCAVYNSEEYWSLKLLIHVHDSFKAETAARGKKNCAIEDPDSHASLAREYLAQYTDDQDLLNIVQYHDLGYALFRNFLEKGRLNEQRLQHGLAKIDDIDLYLLFCIIDSCTPSKGRQQIRWWVEEVNRRRPSRITVADVIAGPDVTAEGAW